jgi:hypothetical protein
MSTRLLAAGLAFTFVLVLPCRSSAQNAPKSYSYLSKTLEQTIRILEPVAITNKDYAANKGVRHKIKVGDKVIIQLSYDSAKSAVEKVTVRFASRRMEVYEIGKVPNCAGKEKTTECVAVVVKATQEKNCAVAICCDLKDGSVTHLVFTFDIEAADAAPKLK